MDKSLFDTCRYTGITKTGTNASEFQTCFQCGGISHKTVGAPRKTSYDLTVDNKAVDNEGKPLITTETIPVTQLLPQEAFRCSYCAEALPNYTELQSAIVGIQLRHDDAVEGVAVGQFAVGSKATLQTAIDVAVTFIGTVDEASTVIGVDETIEKLILDATVTLNAAYDTFMEGIVPEA